MVQQLTDLTDEEVQALSRVFGLLSDPTRVRLLMLLCEGERNVSDLCRSLGVLQPTVSHHLGLLRRAGLLVTRRDGKSVFYALDSRIEVSGEGCELRIGNASGVSVHIRR